MQTWDKNRALLRAYQLIAKGGSAIGMDRENLRGVTGHLEVLVPRVEVTSWGDKRDRIEVWRPYSQSVVILCTLVFCLDQVCSSQVEQK